MKRLSILVITLCVALITLPQLNSPAKMQVNGSKQKTKPKGKQQGQPLVSAITLSTLTNVLANPIAVGYQENSDSLIVSVNYKTGLPNNFVKVSRAGVVTQFSNASGFPEEVYFAVAPSQNCSGTGLSLGGFNVGDVFAGSGTGTVARISADGTSVTNVFATLPGETGQEWGGFSFDRVGTFGGDLLVATTSGGVYRVNSSGVATLIARKPGNGAIEGIINLPIDSRFGPLAGKILVGGTDIGLPMTGATSIFVVDPIDGMNPAGTFTGLSVPAVLEPEGFSIVPAGGDWFGIDFGTTSLITAPASQFAGIVGDLVVASEGPVDGTTSSKLFDLVWDPVNSTLLATEIPGGAVLQYEGISFSCAAAVCVPSTLTCSADVCVGSSTGGAAPVTFATPVTSGGTNPGATAVCTPPSGSVFALGTTPVTCTAPDGCGIGGTVSCGFNVALSLFNLTLTDFGGSGSTVMINLTTGAYVFTCGGGFTVSGIGTIKIKGGVIVIQDDMGGHCVLIKIDLASHTAIAVLQSPMGFMRCTVTARQIISCSPGPVGG